MIGELRSVVIDCPNPDRLASFYEKLLGMERIIDRDDWVALRKPDRGPRVSFQRVEEYTPPQWPGQLVPQQMHLDVNVVDLDAGEQQVLALGATDAGYREEDFRVFLDPAGHPFCLVDVSTETP
jgi:catechol 2,3-dioxygenase-like lactoylglutathione lyase family enzyme